jgi:RNA polymerase sigma-70 factor (ECF subfamily)
VGESSDRQLVERCLNGSTEAFRGLVLRYESKVTGFCRRILGSREDAEDASIAAFVKAWRSLSRYDVSRPFATWLFTIAGREAVSIARSRKVWTPLATDGDDAALVAVAPDDPEASAIASEERERLMAGLARLETSYRTVLVLRYQLDLSYGEIASILQVPAGTVGTLLHRAKRQLRQCLEEGSDERL